MTAQRPLPMASDPAQDLGHGEFAFNMTDFQGLADIVLAESGIALEAGKVQMVYARLAKRLRRLGMTSFRRYRAFVGSEAGAAERLAMVEALTTNVTRFFREKHHFTHLTEHVLPELVQRARRGERIRLWSAGCSSGEEAYSIALAILALAPDAPRMDIKILATDINTRMLATGRAGVYPANAGDYIDPALRDRWMDRQTVDGEACLVVGEALRALVAFRPANLVDEAWPMRGPFQVIFCRNVLIYFETATRDAVLAKLVERLAPGGHIYVGHSERIPPGALDLNYVGLTAYRRDPTGRTPEPPTNPTEPN
ncbi:MAG: CheR family methyltransferase [Pseudomonadota bacterium]